MIGTKFYDKNGLEYQDGDEFNHPGFGEMTVRFISAESGYKLVRKCDNEIFY